ncbi:MAG: PD40 domain-containing protein [Bacteroides sp.]|nr:PD40 domain-containing protein [Bacteroides sp.]
MKDTLSYFLLVIFASLLTGCSHSASEPQSATPISQLPDIFPDYVDVTIPPQIAPLRFMLRHAPEEAIVSISCGEEKIICEASGEKGFLIDEKQWDEMLEVGVGKELEVKVFEKKGDHWQMYLPFHWSVSPDSIDPYLAYRLLEPGYEIWNQMGIYQRRLADFKEEAIISNHLTGQNCINCHSFPDRDPNHMVLHMRGKSGGTYLFQSGDITKLNGEVSDRIPSLVYPSWHPTGDFIAFSTNQTRQAFHFNDANRIEVMDYASDLLLYDVKKNEVMTVPQLFSDKAFETFPHFSPNGKTLYFCSAEAQKMPEDYEKVKYSLCSIAFDPDTRTFGNQVDTLYNGKQNGKSVSFPRVSPDGKFLVFTLFDYGNFSIWHKEADLYLANLQEGTVVPLDAANSDNVESYHSWSSNGRWLVYSSRRIDGLYTHPHLIHIDAEGKAGKPFILPQENASFYSSYMQSFNIPEFVKGPVEYSTHDIVNTTFEKGKTINIH